jgi:hypothetical protein
MASSKRDGLTMFNSHKLPQTLKKHIKQPCVEMHGVDSGKAHAAQTTKEIMKCYEML